MHLKLVIILLLTTASISGINPDEIPGWNPYYLENYKFIPILGDCYQLYRNVDLASTCRREPNLENQSCIQWLSDDHQCLGLNTPSNESIVFGCTSEIRFDNCFRVYDNNNSTIVCQELFEGYGVGITTPSNFTILFHNTFCRTTTTLIERQVFSNFVNNFSLDAEVRSCYKVYDQADVVSPYSCLSTDIYDACVFTAAGNCTGLMTPNNEVLILDCPDKGQQPNQSNCYYLYTSDNQIHTVCQRKIEERCVGVVTPSNLTILFECFFCSEFMKIYYYNPERQRQYRQFIKNYMTKEYLGENSHLLNFRYRVQQMDYYECFYKRTHWIPKTSCIGITLESNETIILDCVVQSEKLEESGCFKMVSPDEETQTVCAKVLNEFCVGLTTPKNWSVALICYPTYNECYTDEGITQDSDINLLPKLNYYLNSRHVFQEGSYISVYKDPETVNLSGPPYQVQRLYDQADCLGLLTETEIIVLDCPSVELSKGCFGVFKRDDKLNSKVLHLNMEQVKIQSVCITVLDSRCVGILTPDNWIVVFYCMPVYRLDGDSTSYIPGAASTTQSFLGDIQVNKPIRE